MTNAAIIETAGLVYNNPRQRDIQAIVVVRIPAALPRTLGGVKVAGHFGGTRVEPISKGVKVRPVIDAYARHGIAVLEYHEV